MLIISIYASSVIVLVQGHWTWHLFYSHSFKLISPIRIHVFSVIVSVPRSGTWTLAYKTSGFSFSLMFWFARICVIWRCYVEFVTSKTQHSYKLMILNRHSWSLVFKLGIKLFTVLSSLSIVAYIEIYKKISVGIWKPNMSCDTLDCSFVVWSLSKLFSNRWGCHLECYPPKLNLNSPLGLYSSSIYR